MKTFFAVLLALAAATSAAPTELEARQACKPATYACAWNPKANLAGWQVCDTSGHWVYAGDCPSGSRCEFSAATGSPYCIPNGVPFP